VVREVEGVEGGEDEVEEEGDFGEKKFLNETF
jgi:hypothetical protein